MNKIAFVLMLLVAVLGFLLLAASNKAAAGTSHGRQALSAVVPVSLLLTMRHPSYVGQVHVPEFVKNELRPVLSGGALHAIGKNTMMNL